MVGDGALGSLELECDACALTRFRRLLVEGSENALAEAVSLYHGPLLQGFVVADAPLFEEWLRFEGSEVRQAYLAALQRLAALAEQRQSVDRAVTCLTRLVPPNPLSE